MSLKLSHKRHCLEWPDNFCGVRMLSLKCKTVMTPVRICLGQSLAELAAPGYVRYFTMYASEVAWYLGNGGQANPKGGASLALWQSWLPPLRENLGVLTCAPCPPAALPGESR